MDVKTSRHRALIIVDKYELQESKGRSCFLDQWLCRVGSLEKHKQMQRKHHTSFIILGLAKAVIQPSSHLHSGFPSFQTLGITMWTREKHNKAAVLFFTRLGQGLSKIKQLKACSSLKSSTRNVCLWSLSVLCWQLSSCCMPSTAASLLWAGLQHGVADSWMGEYGGLCLLMLRVCLPFSQGCVCRLCRCSPVTF